MISDREVMSFEVGNFHVNYPRRVRTPPVAALIAAPVDLFFVNPIKATVENVRRAVRCQRPLVLCGDVHDVEIVIAYKTDETPVGTETLLGLLFRAAGQPQRSLAVEVVIED